MASAPLYLTRADVPPADVAREWAVYQSLSEREDQAAGKTRPPAQLQRVVSGRLEKRLAELCLLQQAHVAEEGQPIVNTHLQQLAHTLGGPVTVTRMLRWTVGEE